MFDELLFRGFHSLWHGASERRLWKRMIPKEFTRESAINNSTYSCDNIHEARWLSRIRDLAPHIILSVCTHTVFKPELFNIPKFGMFMLHEGLTPEYRGLHTPAWALLRKETELIGYTLLKIDEGIDTGRILCQGSYPDADNYGFCWSFIGHSALIHGLPQIKEALDGLYHQHGEFHEVSQANRNSSYYSWMALSDYLRFKIHENRRN
ncbi:MAG: formyltransferase family protein [Anaerolineales bacterium]